MVGVMTTTEKDFKHGIGGYNNRHCRCDVCAAAKREYQAEYRVANRTRLAAVEEERFARVHDRLCGPEWFESIVGRL